MFPNSADFSPISLPGLPITLYASSGFEESFARVEYLVKNRKRCGLLMGTSGVGKSTLLSYSARALRRAGREVVQVDLLSASEYDVLSRLAAYRSTSVSSRSRSSRETHFQLWRAVVDRFEELRCQGIPVTVIADHVDRADDTIHDLLTRVLQFDELAAGSVTLILGTDQARLDRLNPRLLEAGDLRIELDVWSLEDVVRFLEQCAGTPHGCAFHGDAAVRLWELSGGNPRRTVQYASLARVAALGHGRAWIDHEIMSEVFEELSVPAAVANVAVGGTSSMPLNLGSGAGSGI